MIEEGIASTVVKTSKFAISPFGKLNLIITTVFFIICIIYGAVEMGRQHSAYPLFEETALRFVASDHKISQSIDTIRSEGWMPYGQHWYSWQTIKSLGYRIWFWINIASNVWFTFFIIYWLVKFAEFMSQTSPFISWMFATMIFVALQVITGLLLYMTMFSGLSVAFTSDKGIILTDALKHSYPFEGMIKLFFFIKENITGGVIVQAHNFINSDLGQIIGNVPNATVTS